MPWGRILVTIVLVAGAGAFAWSLRSGPAQTNPAIFTIPTVPPGPRTSPTPSGSPMLSKAFEEGRRLLAQGNAPEAVKLLADAVAEAPGNALYLSTYGKALWETGAHEDAIAKVQEAVSIDPAYRTDLARLLNLAGKGSDAAREYEAILGRNPNDVDALTGLAGLYTKDQQFDRALPYLKQAAQQRPEDLEVAQELGYALEKTGDVTQAAEIYRKVLDALPDAAISRGRLGEVLMQQGKQGEAIALYREGIQKTPDSPILRRGLAGVLERAGRMKEAAKEYREYSRLAPNAADAKTLLDRAAALERSYPGGS